MAIRSASRPVSFAFVFAVTTGALAQRPGPAPIVVSGSGSGPVRVSQGGRERIVAPATSSPMIAQSTAGDSAFDVPDLADESVELDAVDAVDESGAPVAEEAPMEPDAAVERSSGYQPASSLNRKLPGAASSPFSKGYAPSSSLNERMAAQASSQVTAWPVGDTMDAGSVVQWSQRGSRSRGGLP